MVVPKKILSLARLDAGSTVDVSVEDGRLIVEPCKRPQYTLAELLSRCRPADLAPKRRDRTWLRGGPVGREML
jgi:antitoxin component of MazEF toxin-antitoxin module